MKIITNNPYRILGLSVTATERDITKRVSDLTIYAEMGKLKTFEYDLTNIAPIERNIVTINDAARKLEQPQDKLYHSLFWISYNDDDNSLLTLNNDLSKLQEKLSNDNVLDLHNKAIITFFSNNEYETLMEGIKYFDKFLMHSEIEEFISKITGERLTNNFNLEEIYIDGFLQEVRDKYKINKVFDLFRNTSTENYVKTILIKPLIQKIESEIEIAKKKTQQEEKKGNEFAEQLICNVDDSYSQLKEILESTDIQFTIISNTLATQIVDCTIDYFNCNNKIDSHIAAKDSILLLKIAGNYIINNSRLNKRRNDSTITIKEWLGNDTDFETDSSSVNNIDIIRNTINRAKRKTNGYVYDSGKYLQIAEKLITDCIPSLNIKLNRNLLEHTDYLQINTDLVNTCLNIIEIYFNSLKSKKGFEVSKKKRVLNIFAKLINIDVQNSTKKRFNNLYITIQGYEDFSSFAAFNDKHQEDDNLKDILDKLKKDKEPWTPSKKKKRKLPKIGYLIAVIYTIIIIALVFIVKIKSSSRNSKLSAKKTERNFIEEINKKQKQSSSPTKEKIKALEQAQIELKPMKTITLNKYKGNQLDNGSSPYNSNYGNGIYNKNHSNEITFKNGYKTDAIVCLVNYYSGKVIRNEYIRKDTNFKMTNIPNGTYYLKVFSGNDWNPDKTMAKGRLIGGFESSISFSVSDNYEDLLVVEDDGYKYTTGSITLYSVEYGNMESESISENDFFK